MDGDRTVLEWEWEELLQKLASVGERLQRAERGSDEVPHYSEIEGVAHRMARRLSQAIQREAMLHVAEKIGGTADCPDCGRSCRLEIKTRTIESVDGPTEISEPVGECPDCQRSFFPSAGIARSG